MKQIIKFICLCFAACMIVQATDWENEHAFYAGRFIGKLEPDTMLIRQNGNLYYFINNVDRQVIAVHMDSFKQSDNMSSPRISAAPCQWPDIKTIFGDNDGKGKNAKNKDANGTEVEDNGFDGLFPFADAFPSPAPKGKGMAIAGRHAFSPKTYYSVVLKPGEFAGRYEKFWQCTLWKELPQRLKLFGAHNCFLNMTVNVIYHGEYKKAFPNVDFAMTDGEIWCKSTPKKEFDPVDMITKGAHPNNQLLPGIKGFPIDEQIFASLQKMALAFPQDGNVGKTLPDEKRDFVPGTLRGRITPCVLFDPQNGVIRVFVKNTSRDWVKVHMRSIERGLPESPFFTADSAKNSPEKSILRPIAPQIVPREIKKLTGKRRSLSYEEIAFPDADHLTVVLKENEFIGFSVKIWELANWEKLVAQVEKDGARVLRLNQTIYGADEKDLPVADFAVRDGRETDLADQGADVARAENPTIHRAEFPTSFTLDAPTVKKMRELAKLAKKMTK